MGLIQKGIDFVYEKCSQFVDYVLNLFNSFDVIIQAIILLVVGLLMLFGIFAVIKKSTKLIIILAAILVVVFIIWTFI